MPTLRVVRSSGLVTIVAASIALSGCGGGAGVDVSAGGSSDTSPTEAVAPTVTTTPDTPSLATDEAVQALPRPSRGGPRDEDLASVCTGPLPDGPRVEVAFEGTVVAVDEAEPRWVTFSVSRWWTNDLGIRRGLFAPGWDGAVGSSFLVAGTRYDAGDLNTGTLIPCGTRPYTDAELRTALDDEYGGSVTAGQDTPERPADPSLLAAIDEARGRWETAEPTSWTADITLETRAGEQSMCGNHTVRVVMQDGDLAQAVSRASGCEVDLADVPTVDDLFDELRRVAGAVDSGVDPDELFDPTYGFPLAVGAEDRSVGVHLGVRDFRPLALPLATDASEGLAEALARWLAAGIDDYTWVVELRCFCPAEGPVEISVVDGKVVGVEGEPRAEPSFGAITVLELFDRIAEALTSGEATVSYDPNLGYPLTADLDPVLNGIDDESSYIVISLTPTGAPSA